MPGGVKTVQECQSQLATQPHCHGDHRDETALARLAATGPPGGLDPHPTGRFVEERKKPGIEAKRIVALGPGESLRYRK